MINLGRARDTMHHCVVCAPSDVTGGYRHFHVTSPLRRGKQSAIRPGLKIEKISSFGHDGVTGNRLTFLPRKILKARETCVYTKYSG